MVNAQVTFRGLTSLDDNNGPLSEMCIVLNEATVESSGNVCMGQFSQHRRMSGPTCLSSLWEIGT